MPRCRFGERQYELAANLELLAGSSKFFTPTTSQEARLGIDIAMAPGDARIWRLLSLTPPKGVPAGPKAFPGWPALEGETPFLVCLFLQYKRSTYLTKPNAKEWRHHEGPYWRVELARRQHETLITLETSLARKATVRYAAPKFWSHEEMWTLQATGGVVNNSLFVAPTVVGPSHACITWSPARLMGHSNPERLSSESPEQVARQLLGTLSTRTPERRDSRAYLGDLVSSLPDDIVPRRRREKLRDQVAAVLSDRETGVSAEEVMSFADIAVLSEAASVAHASWLLVAVREKPPPTR